MNPDDITVKEYPDMTSVYRYRFGEERPTVGSSSAEEGACVKHIFTGPHEGLKVQATRLFTQVQEGIELGWQSVTTGVAEGTSGNLICCPYLTLRRPCSIQVCITLGGHPTTAGLTTRSHNAFTKYESSSPNSSATIVTKIPETKLTPMRWCGMSH